MLRHNRRGFPVHNLAIEKVNASLGVTGVAWVVCDQANCRAFGVQFT